MHLLAIHYAANQRNKFGKLFVCNIVQHKVAPTNGIKNGLGRKSKLIQRAAQHGLIE